MLAIFLIAAILDTLCDTFLPQNVSAILYVTKDETYGRNTASSQYFLQLVGYLGIPVIAWNADNSGLEQVSRIVQPPSPPFLTERKKWSHFDLKIRFTGGIESILRVTN